ncbi:MAG: efflux RND transporter periplasmic adaptor subunit [Eubacteriales bacterium]|jgi:RND family efflux transporter MFP subunit
MWRQIKFTPVFLFAALLVFIFSGCADKSADRVKNVKTAVAGNQELETKIQLSGVLLPEKTVDISSKISGQVVRLGFEVGSAVKAGDVLMQLDTESLKAQLLQAQAGLQSAEASVQSVQNQASLAKINLDAAQKAYDRTKTLFDSGAIPLSQMDDVTDKLDIAKNQFENASGPALNQAKAAVSTAGANIKNLQVQINYATVKSPSAGIVASRNVDAGEVVSAGVPVISIVDTQILKMKSTVTQDELPLFSVGKEVDLTVDSYPDIKFKGAITSLGPVAVSTGEVFPVEISVKNNGSLKAGLSAHASVAARAKGIVVPVSAIVQDSGKSYVFVIKDKLAERRAVKTGLKNDQLILILTGLNKGERVAVTNISSLTDRAAVNPS